jgi:hypothetical protein
MRKLEGMVMKFIAPHFVEISLSDLCGLNLEVLSEDYEEPQRNWD